MNSSHLENETAKNDVKCTALYYACPVRVNRLINRNSLKFNMQLFLLLRCVMLQEMPTEVDYARNTVMNDKGSIIIRMVAIKLIVSKIKRLDRPT